MTKAEATLEGREKRIIIIIITATTTTIEYY